MTGDYTFDPLHLASWASLNRTQLRDDPSFEAEARGQFAGSLLSSVALRDALAAHAPAPVAERFGRCLAYLLITLLEGAPSQWADPYRKQYLQHWTTIRSVRLGGGNARGEMGRLICDAARRTLAAYGHADLDLQIAETPQSLALLGAARSSNASTGTALVYDFGGTFVKHGVASYEDGALSSLRVLEPMPALFLKRPSRRATFRARYLARYMTSIIAQDWQDAASTPHPEIRSAIGSYVRDGQLRSSSRDTYGLLNLLPARNDVWLSEELSKRIGQRIDVTFSHDGTTAARAFAGQPHTAVIMLGTWLGVGFAPEDASGLRPLAPDFEVTST